jgi:2-oxoglutarate ferredoxin oxidoreductase subunit beta
MSTQRLSPGAVFSHMWCPGAATASVLNGMLRAVEQLGMSKNEIVMVSGIGCSSRISGYVDFHTLHTITAGPWPLPPASN